MLDGKVFEMTSLIDSRQQAIALLNRLSPEKLSAIVQLLDFLVEPSQQSTSNQEVTFLQLLQQSLTTEVQQRLAVLRDRCEWGELTEADHQELIGYEDLVEQQRVERLKAMMQERGH